MKDNKQKTCSICQNKYDGFGNNAWPVNDGRCCDHCNWQVVVPARIAQLYGGKGEAVKEVAKKFGIPVKVVKGVKQ